MASIANDPTGLRYSAESNRDLAGQPDPLTHLVQVALAVYLAPAIAIVCAIGGISILASKASGAARRFSSRPRRFEAIGQVRGVRPSLIGERNKSRVEG